MRLLGAWYAPQGQKVVSPGTWADSLMAFDFPFGRRPLVLRLKPQAQAEQADFTGQQYIKIIGVSQAICQNTALHFMYLVCSAEGLNSAPRINSAP